MKALARLASAICLLSSFPIFGQTIFINEFLASNSDVIADEFGEHDDWVELFNPGTAPVDIGGTYLTDDLSQPTKWQIPTSDPSLTTIPAGGFLLLWFDGEPSQGILHVDAKLSAGGEDIGLFAADGSTQIDALSFGPQTANVSFGRVEDGSPDFEFFQTPTPNESNSNSTGGDFAEAPIASVTGGFFQANLQVELSTATPNAEIRYTLGGSEPKEFSQLYTGPLDVAVTTTLRARTFAAGLLASPVTTHSYFFGVEHDFPVVALSFENAQFFDPTIGIYPNWGADWERTVHVEFFEEDGNLAFGQTATVEIHGTGSAALPQKSLRLKALADGGSGSFEYSIFPDLPFESYKRFLLRNSGQDWSVTQFRDAMMTSLTADLSDVGTLIDQPKLYQQAFRPAIVYLNGEYWGIHNLREHMTANYLEQHLGLSANDIDLLDNDEVKEGSIDKWNDLITYLLTNHFFIDDQMEQLEQFVDLPHWLDYNVFNILIDNSDWPGNNYRRWREKSNSGKWRFLNYDLDLGFGLLSHYPGTLGWNTGDASLNTLARSLDSASLDWPNPWWATLLFRRTMENPQFRTDFANRTADFLNVLFDPQRVNSRIDEFEALYQPEINQHFDNWTPGWNPWPTNVQLLRNFADARPGHVRQHVVEVLEEVTGTATVTLQADPPEGGSIEFSTLNLPQAMLPWSGEYFTGIDIPVQAVPAPGYVFVGWSDAGLGSLPSANVNLDGDVTLTAIFEQGSNPVIPIVINEINYNSSATANSGDWVELCNPNDFEVDLSGWQFEDESGNFFPIPSGTVMPPQSFLVLAENSNTFNSVYPLTTNQLGNFGDQPDGFKLSNDGERIALRNTDLVLIDTVRYDDESPWHDAADGTGKTLQLLDHNFDNALPQSWKANPPTPGQGNSTVQQVQSIDFPGIPDQLTTAAPFQILATASSGLPVAFSIVSGPASIVGDVITLTGVEGTVLVSANQPGSANWLAATPVFRSFNVVEPVPVEYCDIIADRPWLEWIERVQFGAIDHVTFKTQYGDFTDVSTEAVLGSEMTLAITPAFSWEIFEENFRAWIDFNLDGDFDDPGELVLEATGTEAVTADVAIPPDAAVGPVRMRVAMRRGQWPEPCENFVFGEVEDYTVELVPDGNVAPGDGEEDGALRLNLFPNPVNEKLGLQFFTQENGPVGLTIVNSLGVEVFFEKMNLQSGEHAVELDVAQLQSGTFKLVVDAQGMKRRTVGFVKVGD